MTAAISKLGPGILLAAAAVGVSHLVQSTRAGADYGLTMIWVIFLIVLLKYPAFRFASEYAGITGNSLVRAYSNIGRVALGWLTFAMLIELMIGASAVSLVTAGVLINVFNLPISSAHGAIGVAIITALVLASGKYSRAEKLVKVLVLAFSILTVIATAVALTRLGGDGRAMFSGFGIDWTALTFIVAMTGWMPLPMSSTAFQSIWIREKRKLMGDEFSRSDAIFDLNLGWILTLVLAICFVIMGTAILFETGTAAPASSPEFAALLFSVFTDLAGDWIYPLIAAAGIVVIWSTLFAIVDAAPRLCDRLYHEFRGHDESAQSHYRIFLVLLVLCVTLVVTVFLGDFTTFIDFSASTGFLVAPAFAWFNYRAIRLPEVVNQYQPARWMLVWHWVAFVAFLLFAVLFFIIRFS